MLFYLRRRILIFILLTPLWGLTPMFTLILLAWLLMFTKLINVSSHTLLVLLLLEFFMLFFLFLLFNLKHTLFSRSNFILTFFTLAVCEASLGLGLLITLSRKFGSQLLTVTFSFRLNKPLAFKANNILSKAPFSITITLNFQLINL